MVSGAGAKSRSFDDAERNATYWQMDDTAGFFMITVEGNKMHVEAYTVDSSNGDYIKQYENVFKRRK